MLVEALRFTAAIDVAATFFGCSSSGPVQLTPSTASSEQKMPIAIRENRDDEAVQYMQQFPLNLFLRMPEGVKGSEGSKNQVIKA